MKTNLCHHNQSPVSRYVGGILLCFCLIITGCKPWSGEQQKSGYQPKKPDPSLPQNWQTSESGLEYRILREPVVDKEIKESDKVFIHYKGTFENGQVFDSSYDNPRSRPSKFDMRDMIQGMREACILAGIGGMVEARVPPELGYGNKQQGIIPPNTTLTFLVEPINVQKLSRDVLFRLFAKSPYPTPDDAPTEYQTTQNGVKYKLNIETDRLKPTTTDSVALHYRAELENGEPYFQTYSIGEGAEGSLIALPLGIKEAIAQCPINGQVEAIIPSDLLGARTINWLNITDRKLEPIPEGMGLKMLIEVFAIKGKDHPHHPANR